MLIKEGKLKGKPKQFPLTIKSYYDEITYDTQDDLVDTLFAEYESRLAIEKDKQYDVKISDACWFLGIEDTICLIDERTIDLIRKFQFYKNTPHLIDNPVWFEAYIIMDNLTPKMF